jgi:hypothetical protein
MRLIKEHADNYKPLSKSVIPGAERSKARVSGRSPAGIAGSKRARGMDVCLPLVSAVLSRKGLCNGPIPRQEESYRLWCVLVCDLEISRMRTLKLTARVVNARFIHQ